MADIRVPTLGESVTEATVGKWFKKPGDPVAVDEPLVELETDKVTLEVPAPAAGMLGDIELMLNKRCLIGAFPWRYEGLEGCPCRIVCFVDAGDNVEAMGDAAKAILPPR